MNNNLIINDENVAKIVTILKYVTLTFNDNIPIVRKEVPGEIMDKPFIGIINNGTDTTFKYYKILYSWLHGTEDAPIIVPNNDEIYNPNWCNIKVSNYTLNIFYDQNGNQHQDSTFNVYSDEPLYFKGETQEGGVTRNVKIRGPILLESNNKYRMPLSFIVNGVVVSPGIPKNFTVKVSIYKDRICSKYLGYINVSVKIINTSGPGE